MPHIETDEQLQSDVNCDIWEVTAPCYDNTTLKSLNRSGAHPDADLFTLQVRAVELARPKVVISEMTSPHSECHLIHQDVGQAFLDIGYDVTITERLPSDCCGDCQSRQRWILIARDKPSGPLDVLSFADKGPTAVRDVLDPPFLVDERLFVDTTFVPSARGGEHVDQSASNVGELISHAKLIGHCQGHIGQKGYRIYDIDYPVPTITSFGNVLIRQDDGRVRYLSIREMAKASSFTPRQIDHLQSLEYNGSASTALSQIANAVPRGLLHTVYEVAIFDLQRRLDIDSAHDLNITFAVEPGTPNGQPHERFYDPDDRLDVMLMGEQSEGGADSPPTSSHSGSANTTCFYRADAEPPNDANMSSVDPAVSYTHLRAHET